MHIPERVANDQRLTTQEKGLFVEIAAREPVTRLDLQRKGQGRLAVLRMLNHLLLYGYVSRKHSRINDVPAVHYKTIRE